MCLTSKKAMGESPKPTSKESTSMPFMPYLVVALVALVAFAWAKMFPGGMPDLRLPPQSVLVDPRSVATLGANASFREDSFDSHFNPTNTTPPFFQVFDRSFLAILGSSPSIHEVASNDTFAFAHEAPIYDPSSDEVFFASNDGGLLGMSDLEHNNQISKLSLSAAEAVKGSSSVPITPLILPDTIQMTNGGTGPYKSSLLLITSGRGPLPPSIALVNPRPPHNVTVLLDNYFGRQFNSLNDIKVHPSGKIFFTDVIYGFLNRFRPAPQMPSQVYRFDPVTGVVRVVADGFDKCNGLAFSGDGKTAYITDTGATNGFLGNNQTEPATIYAFDVDPKTHAFKNRRVFAYVDSGVPDGIQVDTDGNVYSGCGDGVQAWNNEGTLLGKFFLGMTSANMVFAGNGRLVILAETKVFLAKIAAKGVPLGGP
ncbi:calcium-dependent phosphotriesterase [Desarmillaria tabescens]|uniref:Calcium-dependent phosphotriesterase n=1 Tax=Armillaria tabescens TaxID=1929756 RepID=A0AA39JKM5_ARMTA|nr:calcium-dependent phosphotriesterase [Desarmillaria tabescens]KAK0444224.1 calcium-dependent phosphotriesterase [Desarmillaria tabescens]